MMQKAQLTEVKAARLVRVIEEIISRHAGKQIVIKNYRIIPHEGSECRKAN